MNEVVIVASAKHGGKSYRLCIQVTGHPLVVLRGSGSSLWGSVEDLEETEFGVIDRICVPAPCRNGVD